MQNIDVHIKPDKDYDVAYRIFDKEHVEIDSIRAKGSNKPLVLSKKELKAIEETLILLAPVEEAIKTEYLMESDR